MPGPARILALLALAAPLACSSTPAERPAAAAPEASRTEAAAASAYPVPSDTAGPEADDWPVYGRDLLGSRYSPLAQIHRQNVGRLTVAWTASTGEGALPVAHLERFALESTPLVVDGTMYVTTPLGRLHALDPATGEARWTYDPRVDQSQRFGDFTNRGVATWVDPRLPDDAACKRTIYLPVVDARVVAVDAATGEPCARFGDRGTIDLRRGLRNPPRSITEYELTSPPTVVNGVVVVGSAVADNARTIAPSGEVRGYDARTGRLTWSWDPIPRDTTLAEWRSWQGTAAHRTGAANAWTVFAADSLRGLVFIPTSSPSPDYYGGERIGDNRYANSIVALRASTGELVWHFQTVHHDLWDYDNASPPALVTLVREDGEIPVVLQATKTAQLFVLHRETGKPVFPVEERPVPASDVPGELASPTQPFSSLPPLSPLGMAAAEAWGPTEADLAWCRNQIAGLRNEGIFTPPSLRGTLSVPSNVGGAHWGGVAFDPVRQLAVVPVNRLAAEIELLTRAEYDSVTARRRSGERLDGDYEYAPMRGTPYAMRRRILVGPSGAPCTRPPFGALVAIDLATGRERWQVPLGTPGDALGEGGRSIPGSPNLGGPIITAGGLVFIGAAIDRSLRAYDIETGRELWRGRLPAGARATPATYRIGGKQYVVITAGGNDIWGRGDAIVAFALP